ncbi:MAG: hypothetical protein GY946_10975 [bacterium]|nr:hypothetical protein [bacterium]
MFEGSTAVAVWEQGRLRSPQERAALALSVWEQGSSDPAQLPLDEFNRRLLQMRSRVFGPQMEFYAECARCGQAIEFAIDALQLGAETSETDPTPLQLGGTLVDCRPPSMNVLLAAAATPDPRRVIVERCIGGDDIALSEQEIDTVEEWLEEHFPLLDINLKVECPDCGHAWIEVLDLDTHVWRDIDLVARRVLGEVALLARCYGWGEGEILAMSPERRAHYLELA